jgi:hypothetical protein
VNEKALLRFLVTVGPKCAQNANDSFGSLVDSLA